MATGIRTNDLLVFYIFYRHLPTTPPMKDMKKFNWPDFTTRISATAARSLNRNIDLSLDSFSRSAMIPRPTWNREISGINDRVKQVNLVAQGCEWSSWIPTLLIFCLILIPKQHAHILVQQMALLGFFLPPYATTGIRTHVSRVALRPGTFWRMF